MDAEPLRVWELRAQLARPEIDDADITDVICVDFRSASYQRVQLQSDVSPETAKELCVQIARLRSERDTISRDFEKLRYRLRKVRSLIRSRKLPLP